jgi:membrane-bound serine protease (ClpP class)
MWSILLTLLGAGLAMIILEMLLPGMVMGLLGALSILAGVIYAYAAFDVNVGNIVLIATLFGSLVLFSICMKVFPNSPIGKLLTLKSAISAGTAISDKSNLLGRRGKALSFLRPAGVALFDGTRVDVVAETDLIEAGSEVEVVKVEGLRVVVRRVST